MVCKQFNMLSTIFSRGNCMPTKLLVVADSHGYADNLQAAIDAEQPFDFIFHCGDGIADLSAVTLPAGVTAVSVSGNVDRARNPQFPDMMLTNILGVKCMTVHGDAYSVKNGFEFLRGRGLGLDADLVFFGHTHEQIFLNNDCPLLINPGSISGGCYATVTLGKGMPDVALKVLA
jgi:hypothetical protein